MLGIDGEDRVIFIFCFSEVRVGELGGFIYLVGFLEFFLVFIRF